MTKDGKRWLMSGDRSTPSKAAPVKVHLQNLTLFIQREITDGREIVEVGIFFQQSFHPVPGFLKLGILHLQFNLVDLQFVEQPLGVRLVISDFQPSISFFRLRNWASALR